MSADLTTERLLTEADLAERLNVPQRSVRLWRSNGTGPRSITIGRHVRYRPQDIESWLDSRYVSGAA